MPATGIYRQETRYGIRTSAGSCPTTAIWEWLPPARCGSVSGNLLYDDPHAYREPHEHYVLRVPYYRFLKYADGARVLHVYVLVPEWLRVSGDDDVNGP